jgi:hypothetical protein
MTTLAVLFLPPFNIHKNRKCHIYVLFVISLGSHVCIGFDSSMEIKPTLAYIHNLLTLPCQSIPIQPMPPAPAQMMIPLTPSDPLSFLPISLDKAQLIGRMLVGEEWYDLIDILFLSPRFLGRGTVCYLARRDNLFYVIKDYLVCVL